jgi:hypothetical protein
MRDAQRAIILDVGPVEAGLVAIGPCIHRDDDMIAAKATE